MWEAWQSADFLGRCVAVLLLCMSLCSWFLIFWKGWTLWRARVGLARATAAFWQAPSMDEAVARVASWDVERVVLPLLEAVRTPATGALDASTPLAQRQTRLLRDALHGVMQRLQSGQTVLATVGSVAPFVGLLGTVWGIYHAMHGIAQSAQFSLDKISAPVGEALVMTAAGLVVAIPAVVAFNAFGRWLGSMESELEGFALDLRDLSSAKES